MAPMTKEHHACLEKGAIAGPFFMVFFSDRRSHVQVGVKPWFCTEAGVSSFFLSCSEFTTRSVFPGCAGRSSKAALAAETSKTQGMHESRCGSPRVCFVDNSCCKLVLCPAQSNNASAASNVCELHGPRHHTTARSWDQEEQTMWVTHSAKKKADEANVMDCQNVPLYLAPRRTQYVAQGTHVFEFVCTSQHINFHPSVLFCCQSCVGLS